MSTINTKLYQDKVVEKLNDFLTLQLNNCSSEDQSVIEELKRLVHDDKQCENSQIKPDIDEQLLFISEHSTTFNSGSDYFDEEESKKIYCPRTDICLAVAFSKGNKKYSLMNLQTTEHFAQQYYETAQKLSYIKEFTKLIKEKSKQNFDKYREELKAENIFYKITDNSQYKLNSAPLYHIGIEIENNTSSKYLLGDILNAVVLSKVPIIVVPKEYEVKGVKKDNLKRVFELLAFLYRITILKNPSYAGMLTAHILSLEDFTQIVNTYTCSNLNLNDFYM